VKYGYAMIARGTGPVFSMPSLYDTIELRRSAGVCSLLFSFYLTLHRDEVETFRLMNCFKICWSI